MKALGADLPLSSWLDAISAEIAHETGQELRFHLTLNEAVSLIGVLKRAAETAKELEARAALAPPIVRPDNVLPFVPVRRLGPAPTSGDVA
jgi:hypothetical protein